MTVPQSIHDEESLGKAYDGRLMRRLLAYVRPYRSIVAAALICLVLQGALQLVGPFLTQRVIDVALPARDFAAVRTAAIIFAVALVAEFTSAYTETRLTALLGQRVMHDLRRAIFTHLQQLPIPFFDRNPAGRLITRVTSDVESLNELFTAGVVSGLGDLFSLLAISVAMLITDWKLALASFAVIPFVLWVSHVFRARVRISYREIRTRLARINAFLQERLTGMRIVQLFGREQNEAKRFDALNRDHLDAHLKSITYYALYFPAIEILTSIALASLIVAGAERVHAHSVTVGTVAAFLQLVRRFFQPLQDLSDKYNTLQTAMASSERIFHLLDTPASPAFSSFYPGKTDVRSATRPRGKDEGELIFETEEEKPLEVLPISPSTGLAISEPGTSTVSPIPSSTTSVAIPAATFSNGQHTSPHTRVEVTFDDVWFTYQPTLPTDVADADWVLKSISFTVGPGQSLAIVGHTGAGKSTIVNLLMRFYDPQRGRILVNGIDIRTLPIDDLRALIGYVQQDIFLFAGDITSNIRLSNFLTDQEVAAAAAQVGADRVINRLPGGYNHVLAERGASVSVGERQLLSFARAVAADPALLVLDEATSAVDSEIEADIQHALAVLLAGRTTIAIAHRLSTIVHSDQILVLHHGQVVERGTHRDLLAIGGLYDRLWRLQI